MQLKHVGDMITGGDARTSSAKPGAKGFGDALLKVADMEGKSGTVEDVLARASEGDLGTAETSYPMAAMEEGKLRSSLSDLDVTAKEALKSAKAWKPFIYRNPARRLGSSPSLRSAHERFDASMRPWR